MISLSALSSVGNSVTEYEKVSIGSLKKQLKGAINQFADNIDSQLRQVGFCIFFLRGEAGSETIAKKSSSS